jgi:2-polyprenyl-6-hydroxyphenyl methylase/3-demethylubiquinone-9 3-methyltransferase
MKPPRESLQRTVDTDEIRRFDSLAQDWWHPAGPSAMLFRLNPVRISYILENLALTSGIPYGNSDALAGIQLLDVGCGGGILSEPMARLGANVTGIDASSPNINAAKKHAEQMNLKINYLCQTLEEVHASGRRFEVVLAMEVLEHVADKPVFCEMLAATLKPRGSLFVSTFNKTLKAFGMAIIGAEYLLNLLPRETHKWQKFSRPSYLIRNLSAHGLQARQIRGIGYSPLSRTCKLTNDLSVSYILHASKSHDSL